MGELVGEVAPLAVAIALSPFPIIPAILLLFSRRPNAAGLGFLAGWALGIVTATCVFVGLAAFIEVQDEPPTWASWTRLVLGVLLIGIGVKQWIGRHAEKDTPAWMRSIDDMAPTGALRLGFLLSAANPKILLLAAAAGLAIGSAGAAVLAVVATVLLFVVIASVTVALPVVAHLIRGPRILGPLGKAKVWLEANNAAVMAVVITVIGALLAVKGARGL